MNLSQLKEQVRNILRERSVKAIQKEYSSVIADIEKHLDLYKKSKGTPDEKKQVGHLKTLGEKKKSLVKELDSAVAGLYKNAELKVDEAITNPKKSNPNDLATTVIGWYDFSTDYIDDGGQRRTAIKNNEDVVKWFDSHPLEVKQKAFKVMLSKQPSIKSKIERVFGSSLKEGGGLWANIRAKKARGEKSASKNSQAYKNAVKAGKKISEVKTYKKDAEKFGNKFESVNEDTRRVKLLGIDFKISEMNGRIFFSFVDKKAASVSLRQVGTNKIVNHIQKRLDIAYGKGTFFFKSGDHAEFQNGYLFQRNTADINLNKLKFESVINEATKVHFEKKLKNGTSFQVIDRDTTGMRGTQDKFRMQIVDKSGKVIKDLGSHPSVKGAEKFGNKFESVNEDLSVEAYKISRMIGSAQQTTQDFIDDNKIDVKKLELYIRNLSIDKKYIIRDIINGSIDKRLTNIKKMFIKQVKESVNEAIEPEIINQLRGIVKNKQSEVLKDPNSGKKIRVDMQSANTTLKIYDGLSNVNKENMIKMGLPKMIDVAFKISSKYNK